MSVHTERHDFATMLAKENREPHKIIIGQQRLIELLQRKVAAAEKVCTEELTHVLSTAGRNAVHRIMDTIQGTV